MANEINPSLGLLDSILSSAMQANQEELNIIDFIEQLLDLGSLADGSKIRPWPTQKAILKAFYGIPMEPAEQAYIDAWVAAGKCTWKPGKPYRELVLESGMRSSKTALTSWIVLYEFYKLLLLESPQTTYGFPKSQPIFIIALATTEQQSKDTVFGYIKSYMEGSPYFMGMVTKGDLQIDSLRIKSHAKNVTIIAGHSNCVAKGTLIATERGLIPVEELVPPSESREEFDVDFVVRTLHGDKHVTKAVSMGKVPTLKVKTRWGYEIEGSENHPVMVMGEDGRLAWKKLPELRHGDFVAVKRGWEGLVANNILDMEANQTFDFRYPAGTSNANNFDAPTQMNGRLARLMGYLTGDGCVTIKDRVGLKSMDPELIADARAILKEDFKTTLKEGTKQDDNRSRMYWAYSKKLKAYLEWLGMASVKAPEKRVPWSIFRTKDAHIAEFLRGLFDTDGYAAKTNKLVGLATSSEQLAKDVQILLLKLGILSDRYIGAVPLGPREYNGKIIDSQHNTWQVVVRGPEVDRYMDQIGFGLARKREAIPEREHKVVCDVIPYVHKLIAPLKDLEGRIKRGDADRRAQWEAIRKTVQNTHAPSRPDHGGVSVMKLDRIIEYFRPVKGASDVVSYLEELRDYGLFFDPVEEISEGETYLYDFEVPGAYHFFANGIVSHNSAGLVGRTSKIACFDELARFENKDGSAKNGMDVKANIGRSTTSFREHGRIVSISSAWEEGDAMVQLYAAAEDDSTGMLGFRLNSFDMNPTLRRDDPYIVAQYKQNEVAARRDFEGIRPGGQESFFNKVIVQEASTGKLCTTYDTFPRQQGDRTYTAVRLGQVERLKWPHHSYAHCDPGLKHDSYTFATAHGERSDRGLVAVIDTLVEWRPQHSKDPADRGKNVIWPNDLDNVEDVVLEVCGARNVRRLSFDHWQSASMIQRLYAKGIPTDEYHFSQSFQAEIYHVFRERLANQLVILPNPESSEAARKLQQELIELQLVAGKKIDHKPGGSKDLADAVAVVVYKIAEEERRMGRRSDMTNGPKFQVLGKTKVPRIQW